MNLLLSKLPEPGTMLDPVIEIKGIINRKKQILLAGLWSSKATQDQGQMPKEHTRQMNTQGLRPVLTYLESIPSKVL